MLSRNTLHAIAPVAVALSRADGWAPLGVLMTADRNSEIFAEGESAERVYRVLSGTVRITKLMSDGRRQIAGFHLPGEFFALEAGEIHRFSAEAVTDAQLLSIPRKALLAHAEKNAELSRQLWNMTGAALDRAQEHMLLLGRKSAIERIATFLLDMAARTDAADTVPLPMSRQDIADFLGLTIETVSRTLSQLERDGIIGLPSARQVTLRNRRRLLQMEA
jgi:CRP/FNR family transcriptional regulator, nitrogen fixation regulation protein